MRTTECPGWTADWLNGWLAAVGVTVLVGEAKLRWTADVTPRAVFAHAHEDLAVAVHAALPTVADIASSAIGRTAPGAQELPRKVDVAAFTSRVAQERSSDRWWLAGTLTDLVPVDKSAELPHSPFDPPMPKGITLGERAVACRELIDGPDQVADSMAGRPRRFKTNGLGFDIRRLSIASDIDDGNWVDPVVELCALSAFAMFPMRGDGRDELGRTRGWTKRATRTGAFTWPTWIEPLDRWAIDALLDQWFAGDRERNPIAFETVPYRPAASSDTTRAYGSQRTGS